MPMKENCSLSGGGNKLIIMASSTTYYTHGYDLSKHNHIYGEHTTAKYQKMENVVMLTDITNDSFNAFQIWNYG